MKNLIPFNSDKLELLVDSHHGVYIPKIFSEMFPQFLTEQQISDLSGPDNEFYWETWEDVLNMEITNDKGEKFYLMQSDGDLFAYPSNMEIPEDFF